MIIHKSLIHLKEPKSFFKENPLPLSVGGNIDNATRVLTTAISLETSRGDFSLALALGFVLISLALSVSFATHWFGKTERGGLW